MIQSDLTVQREPNANPGISPKNGRHQRTKLSSHAVFGFRRPDESKLNFDPPNINKDNESQRNKPED
jgi:hypothetical protein